MISTLTAARNVLLCAAAALLVGCDSSPEIPAIEAGTEHLLRCEPDEAVVAFTQAIVQEPASGEAYFGRGTAYLLDGKYRQALGDLKTAEKLLQEDTTLLYGYLGIAYYEVDQPQLAVSQLTLALDRTPDDQLFLSTRGLAYQLLGEHEFARADMDRVIRLFPQSSWGYVDRAGLAMSLADYGAALRDLDEALRLEPLNPAAYRLRSSVHFALGDLRKGLEDQRRAEELDPEKRTFPRRNVLRAAAQ